MRGDLAGQSSGVNVGWLNASNEEPAHYLGFSLASAALYPDLERELQTDVEYQRNGSLVVNEKTRDRLLA